MEIEQICRVFGVLHRHSLDHIAGFARGLDISAVECIFLLFVLANEGINQERLSALLTIDKSATAKAMKSLERAGYIERSPSSRDRRAKIVFSTAKARDLQPLIKANLKGYMEAITREVSPGDLEITLRTIEAVTNRLAGRP
ncbi:MarR family winged helix-turn-helix transcriptional regulator [Mesoterricola silvestris]|uniref:MarR family transcriptional regulator n=1 Tax=Mesoterricola silvestris TaxID=2927979 RepID=A0AA48H4M6_9BACT|nr:MarR family winged helix-turn-helix transcriptional regulator [Mesoterricola silvestris]BDU71793.1 MarR family transcriptional regulator [Mesoterricola silvestris]